MAYNTAFAHQAADGTRPSSSVTSIITCSGATYPCQAFSLISTKQRYAAPGGHGQPNSTIASSANAFPLYASLEYEYH